MLWQQEHLVFLLDTDEEHLGKGDDNLEMAMFLEREKEKDRKQVHQQVQEHMCKCHLSTK